MSEVNTTQKIIYALTAKAKRGDVNVEVVFTSDNSGRTTYWNWAELPMNWGYIYYCDSFTPDSLARFRDFQDLGKLINTPPGVNVDHSTVKLVKITRTTVITDEVEEIAL